MRHHVQWTAPAPFWGNAPDSSEGARLGMRRPALLRFASDAFMDEFNQALETDPPRLRNLEARYETWKKPAGSSAAVPAPTRAVPTLEKRLARLRLSADRRLARLTSAGATATALIEADTEADADEPPLKLYQPAHQRYYLVTAALVCRLPGLPDRTINAAHQEKASFVLRRIRTTGTGSAAVTQEYGFVPSGTGGTWTPIQEPDRALAAGEERLPLFSVNFHDDEGIRRRVMAGLIPTGRREAYVGASEAQPTFLALPSLDPALIEPGAPAPPVDARIALLTAEVIEPWKTLIQQADRTGQTLGHTSNAGENLAPMYQEAREMLQVASWYILLDFARFLADHLKPVWTALANATSVGLTTEEALVWDALDVSLPSGVPALLNAGMPSMTVKTSLREVLRAIHPAYGERLEAAANRFNRAAPTSEWPDFLFPLVDIPSAANGFTGVAVATTPAGPASMSAMQSALRRLSALRDVIGEALPATPTAPVPELPLAAQPVMTPDERAMFIVRCVLERPDCAQPALFSAPSEPFEIAGFFDPDAPARPIRIALPIDTSPAGLRRAPKNAAFMISDVLCGQVNRAKGMGFIDLVLSVLPWPLHKDLSGGSTACKGDDGLSVGMICSLSIPIITICALIILIIMVSLLDIIFRWLPYLFFCFPLPKFSAKPKPAT